MRWRRRDLLVAIIIALIAGAVVVLPPLERVRGLTIDVLTAQQAGQSAGMVVRGLVASKPGQPEPEVTLFGTSPLVEIKDGGVIVLERLDQPGERQRIDAGKQQLVKGAFYDFARANKTLVPGGVYRASTGARQIVFKIDPGAKPGASPILGRLLRLQPVT